MNAPEVEAALKDRVDQLIAVAADWARDEAMRLARSGGIDLEAYDPEGFTAAKIVVSVALETAAQQYRPLDREARATASNLRKF